MSYKLKKSEILLKIKIEKIKNPISSFLKIEDE